MRGRNPTLRDEIEAFCAEIGADPLLVQGAGGNVSWKDNQNLWVKASGTWLAEAAQKDIFVSVDLVHLRSELAHGNFDAHPRLSIPSSLRPSIETTLHALMPHKVVVHLHAIEVLAHVVRQDCERSLANALGPTLAYALVSYQKPGAHLARAIGASLAETPDAAVLFLKSHGVVIGGEDLTAVRYYLGLVLSSLKCAARPPKLTLTHQQRSLPGMDEYAVLTDMPHLQKLARCPELYARLERDWALYPDHIVFLGVRAFCFRIDECPVQFSPDAKRPDLLFVENVGVYVSKAFNLGKKLQLQCFYEVLIRQTAEHSLMTLNDEQIQDLIGWDAEKYRQDSVQAQTYLKANEPGLAQ